MYNVRMWDSDICTTETFVCDSVKLLKVHLLSVDPWKLCGVHIAINYTLLSMAYSTYDNTIILRAYSVYNITCVFMYRKNRKLCGSFIVRFNG